MASSAGWLAGFSYCFPLRLLTRACIFSLDDQMSWNSLLLGLVMTNTHTGTDTVAAGQFFCQQCSSLDLRNENCGH